MSSSINVQFFLIDSWGESINEGEVTTSELSLHAPHGKINEHLQSIFTKLKPRATGKWLVVVTSDDRCTAWARLVNITRRTEPIYKYEVVSA